MIIYNLKGVGHTTPFLFENKYFMSHKTIILLHSEKLYIWRQTGNE